MAINKATTGAIYGKSTTTAMVGEATTSAASNIYQITATAKRTIDPNVSYYCTATAQIDTTWMDNGWDLFTGRVKMLVATAVSITGNYYTMTALGSFVSWSLAENMVTAETTAIGDSWKSSTTMVQGFTLTLRRYYIDNTFWSYVSASQAVLVQIWEDASTGFWMKGYVKTTTPTFKVNAIDEEPISIQVSGPVVRF